LPYRQGALKSLPDIPPASDTIPGFEAYEWNGVFVPHGTPPAIVRTLNGTINEAIRSSDVKDRFEQLDIETRANTSEEFQAFVRDQMERWGKVVKEANIKLG
jgi:tripartite-type tricarboxylate transporter receptor subunit TctC